MNKQKAKHSIYLIIAFSFLGELALIFMSWIVCTVVPELPFRSLLSEEGVRWLFGHFTDNQNVHALVSIITVAMAYGAVKGSGIVSRIKNLLRHKESFNYCDGMALVTIFVEFAVYLLIMCLLAFTSHAVLLSSTGNLFPSSFSVCIIPSFSFIIVLMSMTYGFFIKKIDTINTCVSLLVDGLKDFSSLILAYILINQFIKSLLFVVLA